MKPSARMHDKTATITPRTSDAAGDGNPTPGNGTPLPDIPCALRAMSSSEADRWGKSTANQVLDFFCEPFDSSGNAISIAHSSNITVDGVVYRALGPSEDQGGRGNVLRTPVERMAR